MEVSTALLLRTPLFRGIPQEALPALLEGLGARKRRCGRGEVVLRRGERADRLGLVLSGTLHIVKEDFWGSRTIVGLAGPERCLRRPMPVWAVSRWRWPCWRQRMRRCCFSTAYRRCPVPGRAPRNSPGTC